MLYQFAENQNSQDSYSDQDNLFPFFLFYILEYWRTELDVILSLKLWILYEEPIPFEAEKSL